MTTTHAPEHSGPGELVAQALAARRAAQTAVHAARLALPAPLRDGLDA